MLIVVTTSRQNPFGQHANIPASWSKDDNPKGQPPTALGLTTDSQVAGPVRHGSRLLQPGIEAVTSSTWVINTKSVLSQRYYITGAKNKIFRDLNGQS